MTGSLLCMISRLSYRILEILRVPGKCRQHHLCLWILFHHICGCPDYSCSISITTYISSGNFQLRYPFSLLSWVADTHMRDLHIEHSYSITISLPINLLFLFLNSFNISIYIKLSETINTGLPCSSCNMDLLLITLFTRDTINNTIKFLTYITK